MKNYLPYFFFLFFMLPGAGPAKAFSVLTHQAVIDAAWSRSIVPVLEKRFPKATPEQFKEAHAYAYGGAIIQDMGYYPLGSKFFTDLVHYVRTGDFVETLISDAANRNELAFALGALAHYNSDIHGHSKGTNPSVALLYPKERKRFGNLVTYEEDPVVHTRVEFSFDVLQAARSHYAPEAYRDFIGFKVARPLLEKAFFKTYGIELTRIFVYLPLSVVFYRASVMALIPEFNKVGWVLNENAIQELKRTKAENKLEQELRYASFKKNYAAAEDKPGASARLIAYALWAVPKIGPLSPLKLRIPTPAAEQLFVQSFDASLSYYEITLRQLEFYVPNLRNMNLDTGNPTQIENYELADLTYTRLLKKLADNKFRHVTPDIQENIAGFFEGMAEPPDYRRERRIWKQTRQNLKRLDQKVALKPGK